MYLASVVIPIYKAIPLLSEELSFNQCLTTLSNYPINIIAYKELDTSFYEKRMKELSINYNLLFFDNFYFDSIAGYNKLMLNKELYQRLSDSEFILIHQLDAYVFKDELEYWCNLGYDYIGAPWTEKFLFFKDTDLKFWKVGNGGFSLRRTKAFIERLNYIFPVKSYRDIWEQARQYNSWKRSLLTFLKVLGYQNTMNYYSQNYSRNEDFFWCGFLENTKIKLKIPDVYIASKFSIEMGAKQFYEKNDYQLPFGCHAWEKYEPEFWSQFIQTEIK